MCLLGFSEEARLCLYQRGEEVETPKKDRRADRNASLGLSLAPRLQSTQFSIMLPYH